MTCHIIAALRLWRGTGALAVVTGLLVQAAAFPAVASQPAAPAPAFFTLPQNQKPDAQPQLGSAPDVVKAFGLDSAPELFRQRAAATPELPQLAMQDYAPGFARTPHIPELFGAAPCPERGPGYFRIKDTAACIHVGGRVGAGVQIGGKGQSGAFTYGRIQADVVTPTDIGDVTISMGVQGVMTSQNSGPVYVGPRRSMFP